MIIAIDIIKFIVLVLVTFFTCEIITNNKKRISIIGTFLITVSTAVVQYINSGLVESLICGETLLICLDNFLKTNKPKYLWAIGIPVSIVGYLLLSNVSFELSILFPILAIATWVIWKNIMGQKKINITKIDVAILVLGLLIIIISCVCCFNFKSIESLENKTGSSYLMNYTYTVMSIFDKDIKFEDSTCLATMISVFPIVLIIAIIYVFKYDNKHTEFFMPTLLISLLEIVLLTTGKLQNIIPNYILAISISLIQIYMMIYIFANVEERVFSLIKSAYIALAGIIFILLVPFPTKIASINGRQIPYLFFVVESFIVLNYTDKRFWRVASWIFPFITIFETISYLIVNIL